MNPLGMDYLTLYGAHPLDYIRIAARVGCTHVSFFNMALDFDGLPPAPPSLFDDAPLRRDVLSCLRDNGVSIALIDNFGIHELVSAEDYRPMFDVLGELGVPRINAFSTAEWGRTIDGIASLTELAAAYGVTVVLEAIPTFSLATLPQALDIVSQLNKPNLKLMIDTMHVSRTGDAAMVGTIDPDLIGYVQVCDGRLSPPQPETYVQEALHERMVPGEGEYPLVDILKFVPSEVIVSMEIPMRTLRERGVSDQDRAAAVAAGARKVLQAAGAARAG